MIFRLPTAVVATLLVGASAFAPTNIQMSRTNTKQRGTSTVVVVNQDLGAGGMADTRDPDALDHDDPRKSISAAPSFEEYLKLRGEGAAGSSSSAAASEAPSPAPAAATPVAPSPAPVASTGGGGGGDAITTLETSQAASVAKIQAGIPDLAVKPDFTIAESLSTSEAITIDAFDAAGPANVAWIASVSVSDKMSSLTIFNGPLTDVPHLVSRCSVVPGGSLHWKLDFRPRDYGAYEMRKEDGSYPGPDELGRKSFEYSGARKQFESKFGTDEVLAFLQSTIDSLEGDIVKDYEIEGASGHEEDLLTRGPLFTSILMPNTPANVAAVVKAREQAADWWLSWATDGQHDHRPGAPVNTQYVYDSKFKINAYGALLGEYKAMYGAEDGQKLAVGESGPLDEAYVGGGS
ncbi:unnamed protein product [Cylindrotheca closterium]|uniref:Phospholipase B-like n=1 Tax=Cylindrotheca closterium TaxID=2856 RepID=A0AAD2G896_9STRA|nr:unnamed protein product [Cylindrotheca closterium]